MAEGQASAGEGLQQDGQEHFAELWLGTHPNGPSVVGTVDEAGSARESSLKSVIDEDRRHWLGKDAAHRADLPYLFKVLSVRQALSIQAHPNKQLAQQLHQQAPEHYPDDNHKPEICIPLGHFEALVGFRPAAEVRRHVSEVPELAALCGVAQGNDGEPDLRALYGTLMRSEAEEVGRRASTLLERLAAKGEKRSPEEELICRLAKEYPGDVGMFSVYFLNYVRIGAEERHRFIYCAPDEPHAYLSGDAVECMAMSDNVVRAGLTQKHKDVDALLGMLTYRDDLLADLVGSGERVAPHVVKYAPPVQDFVVYEIDGPVPEGLHLEKAAITTCVGGSFSVIFQPAGVERCREGEAKLQAELGSSFFSKAGTSLVVESGALGSGRLFIATY